MRAGIFGGTFDPIHFGHLITAQSVLQQRNLDKIIFMPCYISPHKTNKSSSAPIHRLNMVKLAVEGHDKFNLSDYEIEKKDISYTIETIRHLKKQYVELELIIGYDNLLNFESWKEPDEIIKLAKLVVMKRSTHQVSVNRFFANAIFVDTPVIDISSTEIRLKRNNNIPIDFLVPDKVLKYIMENDLYK
jgi:nicotinate-nucleotide adenylyltransferase